MFTSFCSFYNLFKLGGLETKNNYLSQLGVVDKKIKNHWVNPTMLMQASFTQHKTTSLKRTALL